MLTIIGDVHGKHQKYLELIKNHEYTLQVGDFGFKYDCLDALDPNKHHIIAGNHDNYDLVPNYPHFLGDFGTKIINGIKFFFVRGEWSIDHSSRLLGVSYWDQEELSYTQGMQCLAAYKQALPDIVVSHGAPQYIYPFFLTNFGKIKPSRTSVLLQQMLDIHAPKRWIFGHHHNTKKDYFNDCEFQCLGELDHIVIS
jgi:predicted phosphodiesterase